MDFNKEGTGYVSSQLLAHVLQSWFDRALLDGYEARNPNITSEIIEGAAIHLNQNNPIARCLNAGGVICLTTENGGHYALLLEQEGGDYLGFDPWWDKSYSSQAHLEKFKDYHGMVNVRWSRDDLLRVLKSKNNQWIHLIFPN